jgi:hypothetical protein
LAKNERRNLPRDRQPNPLECPRAENRISQQHKDLVRPKYRVKPCFDVTIRSSPSPRVEVRVYRPEIDHRAVVSSLNPPYAGDNLAWGNAPGTGCNSEDCLEGAKQPRMFIVYRTFSVAPTGRRRFPQSAPGASPQAILSQLFGLLMSLSAVNRYALTSFLCLFRHKAVFFLSPERELPKEGV